MKPGITYYIVSGATGKILEVSIDVDGRFILKANGIRLHERDVVLRIANDKDNSFCVLSRESNPVSKIDISYIELDQLKDGVLPPIKYFIHSGIVNKFQSRLDCEMKEIHTLLFTSLDKAKDVAKKCVLPAILKLRNEELQEVKTMYTNVFEAYSETENYLNSL